LCAHGGRPIQTKAIVLDRDGLINRDSENYIRSPNDWQPLPGSLEAIAALKKNGWKVAIATNQSGLARGLFNISVLDAIHQKMRSELQVRGGAIDHIEYCPHGPDDGCNCRKPQPGMFLSIARCFGVPLQGVPIVGDSARDIQAAISVGARPILVLSGNGERHLAQGLIPQGVEVFENLAKAVESLIQSANKT
jgi:D-glycero-D-manno-heptose 1,7-bisphosphate phosphatase